MRFGVCSDVGKVREINEDGYLISKPVFAVADGMGGHSAGEVASAIALQTIKKSLHKLPKEEDIPNLLVKSIQEANAAVFQRSTTEVEQRGMGTTLTVATLLKDKFYIGHIGDSRAYLLRDGKLAQLTEDHSLVAQMVKEGMLSPQEAELHPQRSVLTRALGTEPSVQIDISTSEIRPRDKILLCTDGLTAMLSDSEIERLLNESAHPRLICQKLIDAANEQGGTDNITVVLLEIPEQVAPKQRARWWRYFLPALCGLVIFSVVGFAGASRYMNKSYYIGIYHGRIALYRGLPYSVAGYKLASLKRETSILESRLPPYYRDRLKSGIIVKDVNEAEKVLKDIPSLAEE
jgi:protein phosphatase